MASIAFLEQPQQYRVGGVVTELLRQSCWNSFEAGVAWVRRSGTRGMMPALRSVLLRGGAVRFCVGVDGMYTSREALADLLDLEAIGDCETYVNHNEARVLFHPKVYLLEADQRACLIVGSSNMTQQGLYANTEASIRIDADPAEPVIASARSALTMWRDERTGLARRLDPALLDELVGAEYVLDEDRIAAEGALERSEARGGAVRPSLFRAQHVALLEDQSGPVPCALVLRVRRASEVSRRTQVQLPVAVVRSQFFAGTDSLVSEHDGRLHRLIGATARGSINTYKLEVPESGHFVGILLVLSRVGNELVYEAVDTATHRGHGLLAFLAEGLEADPPTTHKSIADAARATLWRYV